MSNSSSDKAWIAKEYARRAKLLKKIRSSPKHLQACLTHYKDNPVDFISDWGMTYDPRVAPAVMPFVMWERQREYIQWLYDKWLNRLDGLVEKSRDAGATWLNCAFSWWLWTFHHNQNIGFGSRKEDLVDSSDDPDSIFEKIRFLIAKTPKEFSPPGYNNREHDRHLRISNPQTQSTIKGEAGDNIGRGGRTSVYFKDESAFYERPDKIEAALSQNSDVKIDVSTPNGNGNPFYRKRHGGKIDVFIFDWRDDPRKDDRWYLKQKNLLDPVIVAQEIDRDYNASVQNAYIDATLVDEAMHNRPSDFDEQFSMPVVLGVDPARFGDDRTAIACRQGRICYWLEAYRQIDTMECCGIVSNHIDNSPEPVGAVFIDVIGIGAGVVDRLRELYSDTNLIIVPVNVAERSGKAGCNTKRDEIWSNLLDWLKDGPVSLPNSDELRTDLCALQYKYNSNGALVIESKEKAKERGVKSPDLGDALAATFARPISWAHFQDDEPDYGHHHNGRSSVTGY